MDLRPTLALCLAALAASPAGATSVRSIGVRELAARAELVFDGRAISETVRSGPSGALRTCVQFEVIEIVKGPPVASPLALCFAGGARGTRALRVEGMRHPARGERGIYFVASIAGGRIHPLLGWEQGRFLVREGAEPTVTTADGAPVAALEPSREGAQRGAGRGVARGTELAAPGARGITPAAFKARVRALAAGAP